MPSQKWDNASPKQRAAWVKYRERQSAYWAKRNERAAQEQLAIEIMMTWSNDEMLAHWKPLCIIRLQEMRDYVLKTHTDRVDLVDLISTTLEEIGQSSNVDAILLDTFRLELRISAERKGNADVLRND